MGFENPVSVYESIKDAYLRYYDTAFWLRDEQLRAERRALLEKPGVIFTDPLIEPVLPYDGVDSISAVCDEVGIESSIADLLGEMFFGSDGSFRLRDHQADAMRVSLAAADHPRRNIVVTSGTGSGKTESFLLPIFARLLDEARSWPGGGQLHDWWAEKQSGSWRSARNDYSRPSAVRGARSVSHGRARRGSNLTPPAGATERGERGWSRPVLRSPTQARP